MSDEHLQLLYNIVKDAEIGLQLSRVDQSSCDALNTSDRSE